MKKLIFLTIVILISQTKIYSQFTQNSWETGVLINGGSTSTSVYTNDQGNSAYFNLNILPAYYILNGLSIEPQITLNATEGIEPEFNFIGNLSYTFRIKESGFAPYIKAGYGISNSVSVKNLYYDWLGNSRFESVYHSDKFDIGVFNSALGMKFLVNKKIALRGELNFKVYNKHLEENWIYKRDNSFNITQLSLSGGLSFLF